MVHYSFSTILMTFIASNLIIVLITVCFRCEKILLSIGYKLAAVFLVLTVLRVLFPFELPFAKNVYLPVLLSLLVGTIRHPFWELGRISISLWFLFEITWIAGFLVNLYRRHQKNRSVRIYCNRYGIDVTNKEPYVSILANVCGNRKNHFRVLIVPGIDSPTLLGFFHPCILLVQGQDLTPEELYYTFRHETFHHYHHDILTKCGTNLLCMFYWWNPACSKLQKQMDKVLEMRIDDNVVSNNRQAVNPYLSTMIHVLEAPRPVMPALSLGISASLTQEQATELQQRFSMLCKRRERAHWPLFLALFAVMVGIYLGSYVFILEAHYDPQRTLTSETIATPDDFYAIINDDGTYSIYQGSLFIEKTDSLEYYPHNIIVYEK